VLATLKDFMTRSMQATTTELAHITGNCRLPETFTPNERAQLYQELALLYDLADNVMKSAMRVDVRHREEFMPIVAQYLTQVRCSTDIVTALYNGVAFNGRPITRDVQDTFETAIRNIFVAMRDFLDDTTATFLPPDEIDPRSTTVVEIVGVELPDLQDVSLG